MTRPRCKRRHVYSWTGYIRVEFFDPPDYITSVTRLILVRACVHCGVLGPMGSASDATVRSEIKAAHRIQTIMVAILRAARGRTGEEAVSRGAAAGYVAASRCLETGEIYGWASNELFYGTDPWECGWLTAAFFLYDPNDPEHEPGRLSTNMFPVPVK